MAVKKLEDRNIVLIGFMGAGKTTTAEYLASKLKRQLAATDALIEKKEGKSISQIFRDSGEAYFRKLEKDVIREVCEKKNLIIDCGGGAVLNEDNVNNLKKHGVLFYLSATAEVIYQRVKDQKQRPLLDVRDPKGKIGELLSARKSYYEKADYTVDTSHKTPQETAREILELVSNDRN